MGLFRRAKKNRENAAGLVRQQTNTAWAHAEAARPEVTAEARPDPDRPGWGRIIGQEIGRVQKDRASQD